MEPAPEDVLYLPSEEGGLEVVRSGCLLDGEGGAERPCLGDFGQHAAHCPLPLRQVNLDVSCDFNPGPYRCRSNALEISSVRFFHPEIWRQSEDHLDEGGSDPHEVTAQVDAAAST